MSLKKIFLVLFNLMLTLATFSQSYSTGSVNVLQDPRVDSIISMQRSIREANPLIDGYRIQIFMESGNDAVERANQLIENFNEDFPAIKAYLSFGQPYYRVRVGDFRDRLEAEGLLKRISRKYAQAFIIQDQIEPPGLSAFPTTTKEEMP